MKGASLLFAAFALCMVLQPVAAQQQASISQKPPSAEQLAIYKVLLTHWLAQGESQVNLSIYTMGADAGPGGETRCAKDFDREAAKDEIHRFRPEDLPALGAPQVRLVDPKQQLKEVRENDPGKSMGKGKPVENAVKNGFDHGLFTLSEIVFDKAHERAELGFGFVCGGLCGHGYKVVMRKGKDGWAIEATCMSWIS